MGWGDTRDTRTDADRALTAEADLEVDLLFLSRFVVVVWSYFCFLLLVFIFSPLLLISFLCECDCDFRPLISPFFLSLQSSLPVSQG